jgi:hypothetical protein
VTVQGVVGVIWGGAGLLWLVLLRCVHADLSTKLPVTA